MKRILLIILSLTCVLALAGCSDSKANVWNWVQELDPEDIDSAQMWNNTAGDWIEKPLDDGQIQELVALLNALPQDSFTYNKHNRGGTSTYGIRICIASETFHLHQANGPHGSLEMEFEEKLWWIDNEALSDFVQKVTGVTDTE